MRDDDDAWHDALFLVWVALGLFGLGGVLALVLTLVKG